MTMDFPIIDLGGFVAGVPGAAEHAANQLRHAVCPAKAGLFSGS